MYIKAYFQKNTFLNFYLTMPRLFIQNSQNIAVSIFEVFDLKETYPVLRISIIFQYTGTDGKTWPPYFQGGQNVRIVRNVRIMSQIVFYFD